MWAARTLPTRKRAHDHEAQPMLDPHGNHVLRQALTETNTGIETLRDNVDQFVGCDHLQVQPGVLPQQGTHDVLQNKRSDGPRAH